MVGGQVAEGFAPQTVRDNITTNEFGMHMKPTPLYVEVVKCPLAGVSSVAEVERYQMPDPNAPGRNQKCRPDIARFKKDYFVIGDCEISMFENGLAPDGLEDYLYGMADEDEWVDALNDKVEAFTTGLAENLVRAGVDASGWARTWAARCPR